MPAIQLMDVRSQYSADLVKKLKGSAEIQCVKIPPGKFLGRNGKSTFPLDFTYYG
jgi:hypothetical protein